MSDFSDNYELRDDLKVSPYWQARFTDACIRFNYLTDEELNALSSAIKPKGLGFKVFSSDSTIKLKRLLYATEERSRILIKSAKLASSFLKKSKCKEDVELGKLLDLDASSFEATINVIGTL